MATPGANVGSGALLTPSGAQGLNGSVGPSGVNSYTLTTADFTVPAYGATVQIYVTDTSWIPVGETLWVAGAGGSPTAAGTLRVTARNANLLTLLNPSPLTAAGDMLKSVYDTDGDGIVDRATSVSWSGLTGVPPTYFQPFPHAPTHKAGGSDPVALDTLAPPSDTTTLNASTSAHGLAPKTPGDPTLLLRGDGVYANPPPARASTRYIRQRHCDSALTLADASAVSGTGAAITSGVAGTAADRGHFGMWSMTTGTTANNYAAIVSSTVAMDFPGGGMDTRWAMRFVFKTPATLPSGAVGSTTYAMIWCGWTYSYTAYPGLGGPTGRGNWWYWAPDVGTDWVANYGNGTSLFRVEPDGAQPLSTNLTVTPNTWYDFRLYRESTPTTGLVLWKGGVYGGPLTGMSTSNAATLMGYNTALYWGLTIKNGTAGTTSYTIYPSRYEIIGESAGNPQLLGETLITNF